MPAICGLAHPACWETHPCRQSLCTSAGPKQRHPSLQKLKRPGHQGWYLSVLVLHSAARLSLGLHC